MGAEAAAQTRCSAAKGNDELHGGTENDTIDGGPGNDSLFGDEDTDTCTGSSGRDLCHGGAPGTEANTADDPDICSAEKKRSCKSGGGGTLSGTAAGTSTVVGGDSDLVGVEEAWNATFTMEEYFEDGYKGDASFGVVVDGTNEEGCTFAGSGSVTGQAELTIFEDPEDPAAELLLRHPPGVRRAPSPSTSPAPGRARTPRTGSRSSTPT